MCIMVAVFLAKSVKHPFLNEISCAQNLSNPLKTLGVEVIYTGFEENLFHKEI